MTCMCGDSECPSCGLAQGTLTPDWTNSSLDMVLILDTETTGFDPKEHGCIEVAAVMFSIEHSCVIETYASLIDTTHVNEAELINHIPEVAYREFGDTGSNVWGRIDTMAAECDAVLAHNSDFDFQWVPEGTDRDWNLRSIPWIDTCNGVNWPKQSRQAGSLINLAFEHGIGIVDPHRALADCMILCRLLQRCAELGHDVRDILRRGLRPSAYFEAKDLSYDRREEAKGAGFKWREIEGRRKNNWVRKMAVEDTVCLSFDVIQIDETRLK